MTRSIHFGVFVLGTGNHTAGWRYPGADQTFLDIKVLQRVAAIAERGLFDFLFLGDGLATNLRNHPSYACRLERRRADIGSFAAPRRPSPIHSKSGSWKAQPTVSV